MVARISKVNTPTHNLIFYSSPFLSSLISHWRKGTICCFFSLSFISTSERWRLLSQSEARQNLVRQKCQLCSKDRAPIFNRLIKWSFSYLQSFCFSFWKKLNQITLNFGLSGWTVCSFSVDRELTSWSDSQPSSESVNHLANYPFNHTVRPQPVSHPSGATVD